MLNSVYSKKEQKSNQEFKSLAEIKKEIKSRIFRPEKEIYRPREKEKNFVMVPKNLWQNPLLSLQDKAVWIEIKSYDFNKKLPFVSAPTIHRLTGIRLQNVYASLKALEKHKYLVVQKRPGKTSIYKPQALGF